ncbi:hypothetical protein [Streptomyces sp. SID3212]|uniref:hypothetical protein n=1 Tax=Streptomyces sp. SID3212 TaxID=2690259 RepID=UPI0013690124|nr:hypothetical protein [Streptomyces sp. SID3212]MYV58025.1 hypothetical protein [Streptomyces sp. SID3212]
MSLSGIEWGYCGACGKEVPTVMAKGERLLEDHFEAGGFNVQNSEHDAVRVSHGPKCEGSWKWPSLPPENGDDETHRFQDIKAPVTSDDDGLIIQRNDNSITDAAVRSVQRDILSTYFPEETERSRRWRRALGDDPHQRIGSIRGINVRTDSALPPGSVTVDGVDVSQHITGITVSNDMYDDLMQASLSRGSWGRFLEAMRGLGAASAQANFTLSDAAVEVPPSRESAVNDLREMFESLGNAPAPIPGGERVRGLRADRVAVYDMPRWFYSSTRNEALERERSEVAALDERSDPDVTWEATPAEGGRELIRLGFDPDAPFTLGCQPQSPDRPEMDFCGGAFRNRYTLAQGDALEDVTDWMSRYHPIFAPGGILTEIAVQRAGMSQATLTRIQRGETGNEDH